MTVFAPVGIAHVLDDILQLCTSRGIDKNIARVNTSAQPNSRPHIGSVLTLLLSFAVARRMKEKGVASSVLVDILENAPGNRLACGKSAAWVRSLADTPSQNSVFKSLAEEHISNYRLLLEEISKISRIQYTVRTYRKFQAAPIIRQRLIEMVASPQRFGCLINPKTGVLPVRAPCPRCGLMDKLGNKTKLNVASTPIIESLCPEHGAFYIDLSDFESYVDLNTAMRDVLKCSEFIAAKREGIATIMLDGVDWGGSWSWEIVMRALSALGEPLELAPIRLFSPLIVDNSGGKLSKSIYLENPKAQATGWIVDFYNQSEVDRIDRLNTLWAAALEITQDPRKFFRNYTVDAIMSLPR